MSTHYGNHPYDATLSQAYQYLKEPFQGQQYIMLGQYPFVVPSQPQQQDFYGTTGSLAPQAYGQPQERQEEHKQMQEQQEKRQQRQPWPATSSPQQQSAITKTPSAEEGQGGAEGNGSKLKFLSQLCSTMLDQSPKPDDCADSKATYQDGQHRHTPPPSPAGGNQRASSQFDASAYASSAFHSAGNKSVIMHHHQGHAPHGGNVYETPNTSPANSPTESTFTIAGETVSSSSPSPAMGSRLHPRAPGRVHSGNERDMPDYEFIECAGKARQMHYVAGTDAEMVDPRRHGSLSPDGSEVSMDAAAYGQYNPHNHHQFSGYMEVTGETAYTTAPPARGYQQPTQFGFQSTVSASGAESYHQQHHQHQHHGQQTIRLPHLADPMLGFKDDGMWGSNSNGGRTFA